MKATFTFPRGDVSVDLSKGHDISIGIGYSEEPAAYGIDRSQIWTFEAGGFIGDVNRGGSCNVKTIRFTPHGNGTHTECVGHISKEQQSLGHILNTHHFPALLISNSPNTRGEIDLTPSQLEEIKEGYEALVIRTLPNSEQKKSQNYLGTEPPFLSSRCLLEIRNCGVQHLLVDLPSIDAEKDGELSGHHLFWNYPEDTTSARTITEMVFIPDELADGPYLLALLCPDMNSDAVPSKPFLYSLR